ncbi:unnamed protein product, partial [Dovyalis caffra]
MPITVGSLQYLLLKSPVPQASLVLVYVDAVAAAYNLLQLSRCSLSAWSKGNFKGSYRYLAWVCCLLDQLVVYATFASTLSEALEHSVLALTGQRSFNGRSGAASSLDSASKSVGHWH